MNGIKKIPKMDGTQEEIAKQFGVSRAAVGLIKNKLCWTHI